MSKKKITVEKVTVGGLGDIITKVTEALGIEQCDACKKRKDLLNSLFPSQRAQEMTPDELTAFASVKDNTTLTAQEATMVEQLYLKTFNIKGQKICRTCPTVWKGVMQKLNSVYEIQINNQDEASN